MVILAVLLSVFLSVYSQSVSTYLSFQGVNPLPNNSYVDISRVGNMLNYSVQCHTQFRNCCNVALGELGNWFFPNGVRLTTVTSRSIYQGRGAQSVYLRRNWGSSPTGMYCCDIPYDFSAREMLCVGLYTKRGTCYTYEYCCLGVRSDMNSFLLYLALILELRVHFCPERKRLYIGFNPTGGTDYFSSSPLFHLPRVRPAN